MKLGIHVNTPRHMKELLSIVRAAVDKGHSVSVFVTGEGIGLLSEKGMGELAVIPGVDVSFCEYNVIQMEIPKGAVSGSMRSGSQLDNAIMVRDMDRVITL